LPRRLDTASLSVANARGRLERVGSTVNERFSWQLGQAAARLADLSPVSILARGYAIARNDEGTIVRHVSEAPVGGRVAVTLSDGVIDCTVDAACELDPLQALHRRV